MRRDVVLEDYADARRNYISEIRKSFEEDFNESGKYEGRYSRADFRSNTTESNGTYFETAKIRLFLAMFLFIGFLYCWYSDTRIFGYSAESVIEMMEDNRFYTAISDYVEIEE